MIQPLNKYFNISTQWRKTWSLYPFWHLQTDKIWEVASDGEVMLRAKSINPTAKALREKNSKGGLLPLYHDVFAGSPTLQMDVIHYILDNHFPSSIHEEIINFFGLVVRQGECQPDQPNLRS